LNQVPPGFQSPNDQTSVAVAAVVTPSCDPAADEPLVAPGAAATDAHRDLLETLHLRLLDRHEAMQRARDRRRQVAAVELLRTVEEPLILVRDIDRPVRHRHHLATSTYKYTYDTPDGKTDVPRSDRATNGRRP
jgi:hypothetical protein